MRGYAVIIDGEVARVALGCRPTPPSRAAAKGNSVVIVPSALALVGSGWRGSARDFHAPMVPLFVRPESRQAWLLTLRSAPRLGRATVEIPRRRAACRYCPAASTSARRDVVPCRYRPAKVEWGVSQWS